MNRLQFEARNKRKQKKQQKSVEKKRKAKAFLEQSCPYCGYRNKVSENQVKFKCEYCKRERRQK